MGLRLEVFMELTFHSMGSESRFNLAPEAWPYTVELTCDQFTEIFDQHGGISSFKRFMDSLGIRVTNWVRHRYDVRFDNENDAMLFKLSLP